MSNNNMNKKFLLTIFSVFALVVSAYAKRPEAKYVFFFIGDGMGASQVSVTESYLSHLEGRLGGAQLTFTTFPYLGMCTTYSANSIITDSSASGTAIATGTKTNNGMLGVDPQGEPLTGMAQIFKDKYNYQVGVFSSVPLNHATPASFYGHVMSRGDYYTITTQIPASDFDFIGGSGILQFSKEGEALDSEEFLEQNGYEVVFGQREFEQAEGKKIVMVANPRTDHKSEVANYAAQEDELVSLSQMMKDCLATFDEGKPFFIMCEGGEIDWTSHANETMPTITAILAMDEAVKVAYEFYLKHPKETLIIVTADHQTGGVSVGSTDYGYDVDWDGVIEQWEASEEKDKFNSVESRNEFNRSCGIGWTTVHHNGDHVPVYAIGKGAEKFCGRMDNTEFIKKILPCGK